MWKACPKCGKIHDSSYQCKSIKQYTGKERRLRSLYVWAKKSKEIRERAGYLCEVCKDQNRYTYDNLEVHHITKLRDDESQLLNDNNLICLCSEHHHMADNGELKKDYLLSLVAKREKI